MVSNIAPPFIFGGVINGQFVLLNNKENYKFKILKIRKVFEQIFQHDYQCFVFSEIFIF